MSAKHLRSALCLIPAAVLSMVAVHGEETGSVSAAQTEEAPEAPAPAQPDITSDEPTFDFGSVDNSEVVEHTFVIRNRGDASLKITDLRPDCGCTVAEVSQNEVPPGDQATILTRLNLKGRLGGQRKRIRIFSNDPDTPQYAVTLTGTATSLVDLQPSRISVRGTAEEPIGAQTVTVRSAISHPLVVTAVDAGNPHVEAEFRTLSEGFEFEVILTPKESLPGGQTQGLLRIFTESEKYPELEVPYTLLVALSDFVVAPAQLVLHATNPEMPIIRQFVVRGGLVQEFKISEVIAPDDRIETDVRVVPEGYMIRLRNLYPTSALDGTKVLVVTDVEGAAPAELPIRVISGN